MDQNMFAEADVLLQKPSSTVLFYAAVPEWKIHVSDVLMDLI